MFSYMTLEERVPTGHPLRNVRELTREVFRAMDRDFRKLYAHEGRPSIPPEQLLSALLLQVFYGVRSERLLMEQMDYNLLFRWFVGLPPTARRGTRRRLQRTASDCRKAIFSTASWTGY